MTTATSQLFIKSILEYSISSKENLYNTINPSEYNHSKYRKVDLIQLKEKPKQGKPFTR